jgi:Dyp-type peroxidase family
MGSAPVALERGDLQGGILDAYSPRGFPFGRFLLFEVGPSVADSAAGRAFVARLLPRVTAATPWAAPGAAPAAGEVCRPAVTLNIAFTFWGLLALDVPTRTLRGMPDAFIDGMAVRAPILGDDIGHNRMVPDEGNGHAGWDEVWRVARAAPRRVHILVLLHAAPGADGGPHPGLQRTTDSLLALAGETGGAVRLLGGHRGADPRWQDMAALSETSPDGARRFVASEHFGFRDGISNPVFEGQHAPEVARARAEGQGAVDGRGRWRPLRTGEFILGWPDEGQEVATMGLPLDFSRNGTFFALRKLHQDVAAWDAWIEARAAELARLWSLPSLEVARETLMARMAGRWRDGIPLVRAPDWAAWQAARAKLATMTADEQRRYLTVFTFAGDPQGRQCPVTAHIRRANTRDMLDPWFRSERPAARMGSVLNDRRRILRRGLPYGSRDDPQGEHGIILMAYCADLFRQFEFVQQQWMNYGLDFDAGNDSCPITGAHRPGDRFVVSAPDAALPPFLAARLPHFVHTRGGDYFFQPSMTALRMIAHGMVDPT